MDFLFNKKVYFLIYVAWSYLLLEGSRSVWTMTVVIFGFWSFKLSSLDYSQETL